MPPAEDVHIHGILTDGLDIVHRALQRFRILAVVCLPLLVLRFQLLRPGPLLFSWEAMVQLDLSALRFGPYFFGVSTKLLRVSGLYLTLCSGFDRSASFDALGSFAAVVGVDCVWVDGASVGDGIHIIRGIVGTNL